MTVPAVVLSLTVVAGAWLAGYALLFLNRRPRGVLALMIIAFTALAAVGSLSVDAWLDASWDPVAFLFLLVAYAALPVFILAYPVGSRGVWRMRTVQAIVIPGLVFAAAGPSMSLSARDAFLPSTDLRYVALNSFLVACLGVALAEAVALRFRSRTHRREAYLVVLGVFVLIAAGPVYRFEASFLGLPDLNGANWAAPIAGACLTLALRSGDALRVRVRESKPAVTVPWPTRPGFLLVSESRQKYARAMLLAAVRTRPGLAILGGDPREAPELIGIPAVRLPPGDRCAAVLAATASQFLARCPAGVVYIDDFSYVVAHSGLAASVESALRLRQAAPPASLVLLSVSRLTEAELSRLGSAGLPRMRAPDFNAELGRVLARHLAADSRMLARLASARGRRVEDLSFADLPHVIDGVISSIREMHAAGDEAVRPAWPRVAAALAEDLEAFWNTPPTEPRSGAGAAASVSDLSLVRAGETSMAEALPGTAGLDDVGQSVHSALIGCMGPAGEPIFRRVLGALRKDVHTIRREDVPRATELAAAAIADLANALDSEAARSEIVQRGDRLRTALRGIAEDGP